MEQQVDDQIFYCPVNIEYGVIEERFETEDEAVEYCKDQFDTLRADGFLLDEDEDWTSIYSIDQYTRSQYEAIPEHPDF